MKNNSIKVAVIDLYNNEKNQGMRCIQDILNETDCKYPNFPIEYDIFDTRYKGELPNGKYDIYISSGGPGSPFEGEGTQWEKDYFKLMDNLWTMNQNGNRTKKYIFFICHSFQIMARYFKFGDVTERHSKSFGVMPIHKTAEGEKDPIIGRLPEPFYGADFRDWQVVHPNEKVIKDLDAHVLCIERPRPHKDFERAMMTVKISNEIMGTQFHPEADPASMYYHFRQPERKEQVKSKYGENIYFDMLKRLEDPNGVTLTRNIVLPGFLTAVIKQLRPEETLESI